MSEKIKEYYVIKGQITHVKQEFDYFWWDETYEKLGCPIFIKIADPIGVILFDDLAKPWHRNVIDLTKAMKFEKLEYAKSYFEYGSLLVDAENKLPFRVSNLKIIKISEVETTLTKEVTESLIFKE